MTGSDQAAARLPITGYLDRLSARPGEEIEARISLRTAGQYRARLVRVVSADPNPAGPGMRYEDLSHQLDRTLLGRPQPVSSGSYGEAPGPDVDVASASSWTALAQPALDRENPRVILCHSGANGATIALHLSSDEVVGTLAVGSETSRLSVLGRFSPRRWHRIWITLDPKRSEVAVGVRSLAGFYEPQAFAQTHAKVAKLMTPRGGCIRFACADPGHRDSFFTGKIEDPAIIAGSPGTWADPLVELTDLGDQLLAGWDFSVAIESQHAEALGGARPARLFNVPMRAVVGARWTGHEHCWRHAPREYAAIKFHEDDLSDCGWSTDFKFAVPVGLQSAAYALHLSCEGGEDWLPFYVLPPRHVRRPTVVFLAPTFSYQAYGNEARGNTDAAYFERIAAWNAYKYNPDQYPLYGRSLYNLHADGSGIGFATRLRPLLNMRPGFLTFCDTRGSGIRQYPADSHLLAWLEAKSIRVDVITDEDLDEEGVALLEPYRLLLTGTHPEYHTSNTLNALETHVRRGGRMCYLGGNGFYWRVARSADAPGVIELRRAENGVRRWAARPGEYYHAFDGELGGLWRNNGRPPQRLAGTGFSAWGPMHAGYFRRTPLSYAEEFAWMFAGVEGEILGDYGLSGGGAAGFELDRADVEYGTPENAAVLARSEGLPSTYNAATEDLAGVGLAFGRARSTPNHLVRGDITWFRTPNGGGVFAASSICFCGSLWQSGSFGGAVSRLLENVVNGLSA